VIRRVWKTRHNGLKLLGLPFSNKICSTCIESKATRNVFHNKEKISLQIGDIIHTDIAGPVIPVTGYGERYFQVLLDDFSNFVVVKLLKTKSEAVDNVIDFINLIKTQHGNSTKKIRCDNGGDPASRSTL